MKTSEKAKPGDQLYYPSTNGMALLCDVLEVTGESILVRIDDKKFFIPRLSVDVHAVLISDLRSKIFVSQRIEDEENALVYFRYTFHETMIDRAYNWYCARIKKRPVKPHIIETDQTGVGHPNVVM